MFGIAVGCGSRGRTFLPSYMFKCSWPMTMFRAAADQIIVCVLVCVCARVCVLIALFSSLIG